MNYEKPKSLNAIGLNIESQSLKAAYLELKKDKICLVDLFLIEDINIENQNDHANKLFKLLKNKLSITSIPSNETLVRSCYVQLKKEKDIESVIDFQMEPLLPFPIEDSIVDWIKVDETEEGSNLTVFAAKKEQLSKHLEEWSHHNLIPESISTAPIAIASFANYFCKEVVSYYVLHIGNKSTTCLLMDKNSLISAQFIQKGAFELIDSYAKDLDISFGEAKTALEMLPELPTTPQFKEALELYRFELLKLFFGINRQLKGEEFEKVLITGEGATIQVLNDFVIKELNKLPIEIEDTPEFKTDVKTLKKFDIPIGLAISGLPGQLLQIDLRKKEFIYPNPWKRLLTPLLIYFAAAFLVAWGAYFLGETSFETKTHQVKEQFVSMLTSIDQSYDQFEREYEGIIDSEKAPIPLEKLSVEDLFDRLDFLNNMIAKTPQPIALMPNVPRVSDLLVWLAKHPNVVLTKDDTGEKQPLIQIEHLNYSLVKRPEEKKRGGRYEVKVEMEFTSPTPKLAREFHNALIEDSSLLNPKGEVKWNASQGVYRTSFFLQDKTFYPSTLN